MPWISVIAKAWAQQPLAWMGLALAIVAVLGFIYAVAWRRRRWKSPLGLALLAMGLVGVATAGLGAYFRVQPIALSSVQVSGPVISEPPEPGAKETFNKDEMALLAKASLEVPPVKFNPDAPWPQWRGPNRDGVSAETGIRTDWDQAPPPILWKHPAGTGYASFAAAHGRLYTIEGRDKSERVLCLNADTGEDIWTYTYPMVARNPHYGGPKATPTVFDGRVYTLGQEGDFFCFSEMSQGDKIQILWKHNLAKEFPGDKKDSGYGFASSPLVDGDLVCVQVGSPKGSVAAFNRRDGKLVWTALSDMNAYSSPMAATIGGTRQIIVFTEKGLAGVRAADGTPLWYFPWGSEVGGNTPTPIIVGDYVFISSGHGDGCALLRVCKDDKGTFKAQAVYVTHNKLMRCAYATCVYHDGYLYGFDVGPGNLKCIDLRTGTEKWSDRRRPKGTLIYADGHLIVITESGSLMAVKATPERMELAGSVKNLFDLGELWALPVLANGRLYVRDREQIVCFDLRKPALR